MLQIPPEAAELPPYSVLASSAHSQLRILDERPILHTFNAAHGGSICRSRVQLLLNEPHSFLGFTHHEWQMLPGSY